MNTTPRNEPSRQGFSRVLWMADIGLLAVGLIVWAVLDGRAQRWRVPGPDSRIVVPVFVLHRVLPDHESEYIISTKRLTRLLRELSRRNFTPITLIDLELALTQNGPLPRRPAVLSFDDAYRDNYVHALPILQKYGWTATFFVPCGKTSLDPAGRVTWGNGPEPLGMTWDEVLEMREAGMEIGSHCVDHVNLKKCEPATLTAELVESRRTLERVLNEPVPFLAYPGGRQNAAVRQAAGAAGYRLAFLSSGGPIDLQGPHDLLRLPRVHVPGYVSMAGLVSSIPECLWR